MRLVRIKKAPAQPGKAIQAKWTTRHELAKLRALTVKAKKQGDLRTWRRGKAVRDYIFKLQDIGYGVRRDSLC